MATFRIVKRIKWVAHNHTATWYNVEKRFLFFWWWSWYDGDTDQPVVFSNIESAEEYISNWQGEAEKRIIVKYVKI